jgi:hypothetical protein
VYDHVSYLE